MMTYPTAEQVNSASRLELGRWVRFLPSPGENSIGTPDFENALEAEMIIMDMIIDRFNGMGGMTPEISKQIGWKIDP